MIPREILKQVRRIEISTRGLVNEVFGGNDATHQPELHRLVGGDDAPREHEVERLRQTHQARQNPRAVRLGDDPSTGKHKADLRLGRGDPNVTLERQGCGGKIDWLSSRRSTDPIIPEFTWHAQKFSPYISLATNDRPALNTIYPLFSNRRIRDKCRPITRRKSAFDPKKTSPGF